MIKFFKYFRSHLHLYYPLVEVLLERGHEGRFMKETVRVISDHPSTQRGECSIPLLNP